VKTWVSASDSECRSESAAYDAFRLSPFTGVPTVLANSFDADCDVHAIVLKLVGLTLEDLRCLCPSGKFQDKMVLAVAIQMVSIYSKLYPKDKRRCSCKSCSLIAIGTFMVEE
jgi:hypothetical protein